jgi:hypothetical protein
MISMNSWNGGETLYAEYTILSLDSLKDSGTSIITDSKWKQLAPVGLGLLDSIVRYA